MTRLSTETVRHALRAIRWPGFDKDIVAAGFIRKVEVDGDAVRIHLASRTRRAEKLERVKADIHRVIEAIGGVGVIDIIEQRPERVPVLSTGGRLRFEQGGLRVTGAAPAPVSAARSPDDAARPQRAGPDAVRQSEVRVPRYTGSVPVHQWDIDPTDPRLDRGEAFVELDGWEYRLWWQHHPDELVYVSIQAIKDDTLSDAAFARPHPVGRAVAVNLVYDLRRRAIVAIYGTARDFRPFVEAFWRGYGPSAAGALSDEEEAHG